jgi:UDP-N-acetylglucosamine enolpyruvyl transferase
LEFASVGATVNIMLAAVKATGVTKIINAAREVEISNLADMLRKMGAKITGDGTDTIIIEGVDKLGSADIKVIPDRIEAGTYIIIGAMLGKDLVIEGIVPQHIKVLLNKLRKMGANFKVDKINNIK